MKRSKNALLLTFFIICTVTIVSAQSTEEKDKAPVTNGQENIQQVNIPESYGETQKQEGTDATAGTSTYNIVENETPTEASAETGAASWRDESSVEVLRVYSGSHDGNNLVKTIEVRKNPDASGSRSEYIPK